MVEPIHVKQPYTGECDFCCARDIKWRYHVKTFEEQTSEMKTVPVELQDESGSVLATGKGIVWVSHDDWGACNNCYTVIQQAIKNKSNRGGVTLMIEKILPRLWANTCNGIAPAAPVVAAVKQAWAMFYLNRIDEAPARVYDADRELPHA